MKLYCKSCGKDHHFPLTHPMMWLIRWTRRPTGEVVLLPGDEPTGYQEQGGLTGPRA